MKHQQQTFIRTFLTAVFLTVAFCAGAADYYFNNPGKEGYFEGAGNWFIGNQPAGNYPGEGDVIRTTNGMQKVTFQTPGATNRVSDILLNVQKDNQRLTFDFNGGQLYVTNRVQLTASRYETSNQPYVVVTNGTLRVGNGLSVGNGTNYRAEFLACGKGTDVIVEKGNFAAQGTTATATILDGATVLIKSGYLLASSKTGYGQGRMTLSGTDTQIVSSNGFRVTENTLVTIADKAKVEIHGYSVTGEWGRQNRNSIGIDDGGVVGTGNAKVEIDDAEMSVDTAYFFVAESDRNRLYGHELTVKNNGRFLFTRDSQLFCAYIQSSANNDGTPSYATNNAVRVYSGGKIDSAGNTCNSEWNDVGSIVIGAGYPFYSGDNGLHVSNGVVNVNHITLGGVANASNNWLRIEGPTSKITLTQPTAAPGNRAANRRRAALGINNNARVEFVIGKDGFDEPPIQLTTSCGYVDGVQGAGQKAQIIVFDDGFARANRAKTITLIQTLSTSSQSVFATLIADAVVHADKEWNKGELSVSADGKSLLYTTPALKGTTVLIE